MPQQFLTESANMLAARPASPIQSPHSTIAPGDWPVVVVALTMFLTPAVGVPSELMLQDTLKSAVVAFGVLIAALVFFWQQRQRTEPLLWHGMVWLPLVLMAYALGSMVWSHTYLAGVEAIRWFILSLLMWLGLNTFTRQNFPLLLWGIHGGAVVASLWAVLQFWFDFGLFPQAAPPASTFINRNFFAEYLVTTLPVSVYLLVNSKSSRWLGLLALSLALNFVALMMTGTRSALVALLVLVPVLLFILIKYRQQFAFIRWSQVNKVLVVLVLAVGVLVMGSTPTSSNAIIKEGNGTTALERSFVRAASMVDSKEYTERSFSIRSQMWMATARMMLDNPWTGVGAGAWEVQIPLYQRIGEAIETDYYAHNEYLQLLSEYGAVVGGLFLAVLLAYILLAAGKTWHLPIGDLEEVPLRALVLASLLALMIVSNAGFPWRLASSGALFALCLAILMASDARLGVREAFFAATLRWRPGRSNAMLTGLVCCTVLAGYITQQAAEAEYKIVRAIQLGNAADKLQASGGTQSAIRKAQLLQSIRDGIAINSHYRKITPMVADQLADSGDWADAVWIWKSIAASRPHIAVIWSNIARGYTQLGQYDRAFEALHEWQRLQPHAPGSLALEVTLLSRTQQAVQATQLLTNAFDQGRYDFALLQAGYALGLQTHDWALAIRSLELRNQSWPGEAADGYFRLGKIYADQALHDDIKALTAFRAGLAVVPVKQKENFRSQVPMPYRAQL